MSGEDPGNVTSRGGTPSLGLSLVPARNSHFHKVQRRGETLDAEEMVSCVGDERESESVRGRRRASRSPPGPDAVTPVGQRRPGGVRPNRKQRLVSRLSDSGFEEELGSSPLCSPARTRPPPLGGDDGGRAEQRQVCGSWFLQYGDVGFGLQRQREGHFHTHGSLERQPQLTAESRCKLVSWLIPVHKHLGLSFECCCLAVNMVDRFLASTAVAADCFQLLGVTALLLASKLVEVSSPRVGHLLSMCCDAFTKEQLGNLECLVLVRLDFRLAAPTLAFFLDYYTHRMEEGAAHLPATGGAGPGLCGGVARQLCELSLADYAFNRYAPSLTASCALKLAAQILGAGPELAAAAQGGGASSPEGHTHNLEQECTDNLRLLVSLNRDSLDIM